MSLWGVITLNGMGVGSIISYLMHWFDPFRAPSVVDINLWWEFWSRLGSITNSTERNLTQARTTWWIFGSKNFCDLIHCLDHNLCGRHLILFSYYFISLKEKQSENVSKTHETLLLSNLFEHTRNTDIFILYICFLFWIYFDSHT
jgi:hypothetical protein